MGQGSSEVGRHLPTQDMMDTWISFGRSWHLRFVDLLGIDTRGSGSHFTLSAMLVDFACFSMLEPLALINASVRMGNSRGGRGKDKWEGDVGPLVELLQSYRACLYLVSSHISSFNQFCVGFNTPGVSRYLEGEVLLKLRSGHVESLLLSDPGHLARDSGLPSNCFFTAFAVVWFQFGSPMPRLCHRMRSRKGGTRGRPSSAQSSPSSVSPSLSSGFLAGHYPRTHSGRGRLLDSRLSSGSPARRPPAFSPPPTTGSVRFTFNNALLRPRITAIFTVVFHEEAKWGEANDHSADLDVDCAQTSNIPTRAGGTMMQASADQDCSIPEVEMAPADPSPSISEDALARDLLASVWCRIVEEPTDDYSGYLDA